MPAFLIASWQYETFIAKVWKTDWQINDLMSHALTYLIFFTTVIPYFGPLIFTAANNILPSKIFQWQCHYNTLVIMKLKNVLGKLIMPWLWEQWMHSKGLNLKDLIAQKGLLMFVPFFCRSPPTPPPTSTFQVIAHAIQCRLTLTRLNNYTTLIGLCRPWWVGKQMLHGKAETNCI